MLGGCGNFKVKVEDAKVCSPFEINLITVLERIAKALEKLVENDNERLA